MVDACLRAGAGGSPTAVVMDHDGLDDADLARIPGLARTSHVAVVHPVSTSDGRRSLRFFTMDGELPGCGHGTVAAITVLSSAPVRNGFQGQLSAGGRVFDALGTCRPPGDLVEVWFDQGAVEHRFLDVGELDPFLAALGLRSQDLHPHDEPAIASPGRPRLLIPVLDRAVLAKLRPDQERLALESRRHGQLGCFVYVPSSPTVRACARMFAPAIGVPEDVANANSTGCLAAHMLATGRDPGVEVDQGDALGRPSAVHATAATAPGGIVARVGGTARLTRTISLTTV